MSEEIEISFDVYLQNTLDVISATEVICQQAWLSPNYLDRLREIGQNITMLHDQFAEAIAARRLVNMLLVINESHDSIKGFNQEKQKLDQLLKEILDKVSE